MCIQIWITLTSKCTGYIDLILNMWNMFWEPCLYTNIPSMNEELNLDVCVVVVFYSNFTFLKATVRVELIVESSQQQPAWLLHGHAAASKPGCMVHGMLLLQNRDAWCMACCCFSSSSCCVHACVRGRLRDRQHIADDTSTQTHAWRIEFPYRNIRD